MQTKTEIGFLSDVINLIQRNNTSLSAFQSGLDDSLDLAKRHYYYCRRGLLSQHNWTFALSTFDLVDEIVEESEQEPIREESDNQRYESGTLYLTAGIPRSKVSYDGLANRKVYQLPKDNVRIIGVYPKEYIPSATAVVRGTTKKNGGLYYEPAGEGRIAVAVPAGSIPTLVYVNDLQDPTHFNPLFAEALRYELAAQLYPVIAESTALVAYFDNKARIKLDKAKMFNYNQAHRATYRSGAFYRANFSGDERGNIGDDNTASGLPEF